ncbi:hypothetical protein BpHYR1_045767 [Brachionus plicatilis]|uniref:Uncharacterized protein n=1 Tax=Brachionus plicatilis TaxID=10195 RepID=A0A3M7RDR7_BRAPC|nr:hypothetical protein BpHYR1_045767 [Brachionus plicatilis]
MKIQGAFHEHNKHNGYSKLGIFKTGYKEKLFEEFQNLSAVIIGTIGSLHKICKNLPQNIVETGERNT